MGQIQKKWRNIMMIKLLLFLVLFTLCFVSCKKESQAVKPEERLISDSSKLTVGGSIGSIDSFTIKYSGAWKISINPSTATWLKASVSSGTGSTKVYATIFERNSTTSIRTATIVVTSQNNPNETISIAVSQSIEKQWNAITGFPGIGRYNASGFAIGDKFYIGLGVGHKNNADQDLSDFYEYNSTTNTWIQKTDFPGGSRELAKGFSINGKGYLAMGQRVECPFSTCTSTIFKDIWEYDALIDNWKKVATFSNLDNNLPLSSQVFVINTKAYFSSQQSLFEFNPETYTLMQKAVFPDFTGGMSFFTLNNKAYAVGGYYDGNGRFTKNVYQYDPVTDKWSKKADFPGHERAGAYSFSINGKGYVACGSYQTQIPPNTSYVYVFLNDVWEYNDSIDSWSPISDFPDLKFRGFVIGTIGGKAIIGTGYPTSGIQYGKDFWIY